MPSDATTTDLETALRTTGAARSFTDREVTHADIHRILDVARFAPSGGNQQPWHVVLVEDADVRTQLGELIIESAREYTALSRAGVRPFGLSEGGRWPGPGGVDLAMARATPIDGETFGMLAQAPAVLAVFVELGKLAAMDAELDRHGVVGGASIYPFCRDVLLAARLVGLGGVLTTFAVRREPETIALFGVPAGHALAAVIAIGEPEQQASRLKRRPVATFTTINRFDGPPFDVT